MLCQREWTTAVSFDFSLPDCNDFLIESASCPAPTRNNSNGSGFGSGYGSGANGMFDILIINKEILNYVRNCLILGIIKT